MHSYTDTYFDPHPHFIEMKTQQYFSIIEWLIENIGDRVLWRVGQNYDSTYTFRFKREEDKVKFILRWL